MNERMGVAWCRSKRENAMTALLQNVSILAWSLCAAGLAWYCLNIASQITYVTLADGRRQERKLPLIFRLLLPFAPISMASSNILRSPRRRRLPTASWSRPVSKAC
jgi:hypothetical protein